MRAQSPGSRLRPRRADREAGFTLVEVMAAIAIIAIVGSALALAVPAASTAAGRGFFRLSQANALVLVRGVLEKTVGRVSVPYWETGTEGFTAETGALTMPFLDGEREKTLSISSVDGTLSVSDGKETRTVKVHGTVDLSYLTDPETSRVVGVQAAVRPVNAKAGESQVPVAIRVPFASAGIPGR